MATSQTAVAEKPKNRSGSNKREKDHNLSWRMTTADRRALDAVARSFGFEHTQDWLRSLVDPELERAADQGIIDVRSLVA